MKISIQHIFLRYTTHPGPPLHQYWITTLKDIYQPFGIMEIEGRFQKTSDITSSLGFKESIK